MDRVTKSYLEEFRVEQSLGEMPESDVFELFADYCVVSNVYDEEFDAADVHVGGEDDLGIDGLAVIVNGVLINSVDEAEDLLDLNGFLDVKFVFVQAKTSSGFSGEQIANFLDGVDEFFEENPTQPVNEQIANARAIMTWLYTKSVKFTRQKPVLALAFVTTGSWQDNERLTARIQIRRKRLQDTGLFHEVVFDAMGANEIQEAYQRSKNNVTVEFSFANKVLLPEIEGVAEAYLGVLPAKEYMALITDDSGNIRKPLFYDNVRDFQGDNAVNREIEQTLQNAEGQQRFAVLNNGVTVVTRGLRTTGNKFVVTDYQIVNGCQTSHVLFDAKDHLGEEAHVPLKVISTEDEDIINAIITATNRQTEVTAEDLYAMSAFQKRLEALFAAYPDKKKLYYERRSKQYASVPGVEKVRIIEQDAPGAGVRRDVPGRRPPPSALLLFRSASTGGHQDLQREPQARAVLRFGLRLLRARVLVPEQRPAELLQIHGSALYRWRSGTSSEARTCLPSRRTRQARTPIRSPRCSGRTRRRQTRSRRRSRSSTWLSRGNR